TGGTATFSDKNVGTGKTVTLTGASLTGADAGNYILDSVASTTSEITPAPLTIMAAGINKQYDGNVSATVTLSDNRISGDAFADSYASASFIDANAGINKSVAVIGIAISGADASNYTFNTTAATTATISAKSVIPAITADSKD